MKLSKTMRKALAVVMSLALVITSITVYNTTVKAADTFEGLDKKVNDNGTIDVTWTAYPDGNTFTKVYILEGTQKADVELTEDDAAHNLGANWIWSDHSEYGGADQSKADGIDGNRPDKDKSFKVTRGNTYTVILVSYNSRETADATTEIAREAVVVEVPELTDEEASRIAEEESRKAAEEESKAAEAAALAAKFKDSYANGKKIVTGTDEDASAYVDGNMDSRMQFTGNTSLDDSWFYVDLGEVKEINTVAIKWQAAHAASYDIYVATETDADETPEFTKVASETGATFEGDNAIITTTFSNVEAQYVKVQATEFDANWAAQYGICAYEVGVFFEEGLEIPATTNVATEEATEVASDETPAVDESTEAASDETPAVDESTEAASDETPAVDESTEAASDETPAVDESTEAASDETPAVDESTEAASDETPAVDESTEAASDETNDAEETTDITVVKEQLATPEGLVIDEDGVLRWNAVENAESYVISVDDEEVATVAGLEFDLSEACPDEEFYIITVKAVAENYADSEEAEIEYDLDSDIYLDGDDEGASAMEGNWTVTDKYSYLGYVTLKGATSEHKYLELTYAGDITSVRFEFSNKEDDEKEVKEGPYWFNPEGQELYFVTVDDSDIPLEGDEDGTTVIIDLEKSGIDIGKFNGIHMHAGYGVEPVQEFDFEIIDAVLTKTPDLDDEEEETTTEVVEDTTAEDATGAEETTVEDATGAEETTVEDATDAEATTVEDATDAEVTTAEDATDAETTTVEDATNAETTTAAVETTTETVETTAAVETTTEAVETTTEDASAIKMDQTFDTEDTFKLGGYDLYVGANWNNSKVIAGVDAEDADHVKAQNTSSNWDYWGAQVQKVLSNLTPGAEYTVEWPIKADNDDGTLKVTGDAEIKLTGGDQLITGKFVADDNGDGKFVIGMGCVGVANPIEYFAPTIKDANGNVVYPSSGEATTAAPTTAPTTAAPTTVAPTTAAPTTAAPTTVAPTTTKATTLKLAKAKVKKATKKKAAKKVKVTLKKIKNAKTYQVAIYKTKKNAKKNKKALVKKTVKKVKATIKSKKLKNKKKLFVRARAVSGKTTGAWSKPKKVKVK